MTSIIVDDNTVAQLVLAELIGQTDNLELIATCNSASEAMEVLSEKSIDLIFLDIEMPQINGFEFLKALDHRPLIIVVSGIDRYALESYNYNVVDFLLKPVSPVRFEIAVQKAHNMVASKGMDLKVRKLDFIFIKDRNIFKKIPLKDVEWLEAQGDYVKIKTPERSHLTHISLKLIEEKLQSSGFVRVHRRYIVALEKIEEIEDYTIVIGKKLIPVSESYRGSLKLRLNLV